MRSRGQPLARTCPGADRETGALPAPLRQITTQHGTVAARDRWVGNDGTPACQDAAAE